MKISNGVQFKPHDEYLAYKFRHHDEYLEYRGIADEKDALEFVNSAWPTPVGKTYYTPTDFRWATMALRARLVESHKREWHSLWGLLNIRHKAKADKKFEEQESLVISASVRSVDALGDWVNSRYDVPAGSYLMPNQFATFKDEADGDWDLEETLDEIKFGEHREHYTNIRYYWKKVKPARESRNDERRHVILMDMESREEAPLLPGEKPYSDD